MGTIADIAVKPFSC